MPGTHYLYSHTLIIIFNHSPRVTSIIKNLHDILSLSLIIIHSTRYHPRTSDSSQNIAHGVVKCFSSQHVTVFSFCQFIVPDLLTDKNEKWLTL